MHPYVYKSGTNRYKKEYNIDGNENNKYIYKSKNVSIQYSVWEGDTNYYIKFYNTGLADSSGYVKNFKQAKENALETLTQQLKEGNNAVITDIMKITALKFK